MVFDGQEAAGPLGSMKNRPKGALRISKDDRLLVCCLVVLGKEPRAHSCQASALPPSYLPSPLFTLL